MVNILLCVASRSALLNSELFGTYNLKHKNFILSLRKTRLVCPCLNLITQYMILLNPSLKSEVTFKFHIITPFWVGANWRSRFLNFCNKSYSNTINLALCISFRHNASATLFALLEWYFNFRSKSFKYSIHLLCRVFNYFWSKRYFKLLWSLNISKFTPYK